MWREIRCALASQIGWFFVFGPLLLLLWIVALVAPPAAVVISVLQFLVGGAWLALSLLDYPLSLRGVRYTPSVASKLLSRNLSIYGLGGIIAPFVGIKLIDLVIQLFPGM